MAKVEIIDQKEIQKLNDLSDAFLKSAESLSKLIDQGNKLIDVNSKIGTSSDTNKEKQKKLTEVEKEENRIRNQQLKIHAQLDKARSTANKALVTSRLNLQKTNKEIKDNTIANKASKGSYEQLNAELRLNITRYKSLSAEQRKNVKVGKQLKSSIVAQQKAIMNLDSEMLVHNRNVGNYGSALSGVATNLLGAFGVVGGVAAFASILRSSVSTVTKYSSQNSKLASILGKTKDEIDDLTKSSLAYGRTTQFTATQVSELQTELAKLGFTQEQITDSTEAVLNLAAATGSDLGEAAKVSGAALRAMGLEADEMDRVASVLAVSTTKTALSFNDFNGNLSTILPVAKAFNFSIEDSVALFGKLRDAGFDASSAATATRNILLNLADTNGKLAKEIGGAVGNFDEMIDALVDLNSKGLDLGTTLELTDKRSVAAFNQFLSGAESARTLRDGLIDVNDELKVMVETRTDNAEGAVLRLGSAWDGLILRLKESDGFLKDFLDTLTETISPVETAEQAAERMANNTTKALRKTTETAKEYADGLDLAVKAQSDLTVDALNAFIDDASVGNEKFWKSQIEVGKKLSKELEKARTAEAAEELANRFDIENKNIEELKKLQRSFSSFTFGEMKERGDLILPLIEKQLKELEAVETKSNFEKKKAAEKNEKEITKIKQTESDAQKVIDQGVADDEIKLENDTLNTIEKLRDDNTKSFEDSTDIILDSAKKSADERLKLEADLQNKLKDMRIDLAAQAATSVADVLFESASQKRDEELDRLDEERDEDLERAQTEADEDQAALDFKIENGLISESAAASEQKRINADLAAEQDRINEEVDRKEAALKTKQAKADKAASLISVAISTAQGIAAALRVPLTAPAVIPFIVATGAIQAAAIAATPIPKFEKGTDGRYNTPNTWIGGERGSEMVVSPTGEMFLTPDKPTLFEGMANHMVIPHKETQQKLADMAIGGKGFSFSDKNMVDAINRNTKAVKQQSRSSQVDNVTTTKRGRRIIKKHESFLKSMGR